MSDSSNGPKDLSENNSNRSMLLGGSQAHGHPADSPLRDPGSRSTCFGTDPKGAGLNVRSAGALVVCGAALHCGTRTSHLATRCALHLHQLTAEPQQSEPVPHAPNGAGSRFSAHLRPPLQVSAACASARLRSKSWIGTVRFKLFGHRSETALPTSDSPCLISHASVVPDEGEARGAEPEDAPPWLRRQLPGPRWLWAGLSALILVGGLAAQFSGRGTPKDSATLVRYQVRTLNLLWRASAWVGASSDGEGQLLIKAAPRKAASSGAEVSGQRATQPTDILGGLGTEGLLELFDDALQVDRALAALPGIYGGGSLAEEVVAHCFATEQDKIGARLALRIPKPGTDLQALQVSLASAATLSTAVPPVAGLGSAETTPGKMSIHSALGQSQTASFGRHWSAWTRDRLRLRVAVAAKANPPAGLAADLIERDRLVAASAWTTLQIGLLALLFGIATWIVWLLRSLAERSRGQRPMSWILRKYPGLPNDNPYLADPLTPWVAVAGWILAQIAAAPLAMLPGMTQPSPFAALLGAMVGLMAVQALIGWLSPARVPIATAARLGGDPTIPFGVASTAALRSLALLLPMMLLATLLSALWMPQVEQLHSAVDLSLARSDLVGLIVMGLAAVVVAPVAEELLFRGLVLRQIRQRLGPLPALLTSSLLFAAMHGDPSQMLTYTVLGAGFGLGYLWSGSLWTPVVMHALWNLTAVILMNCVVLS